MTSAALPVLPPSEGAALLASVNQAADASLRLDAYMTDYFKALGFLLEELRDGRSPGTYPQQERILPSTRTLPSWLEVEIAWENAQQQLTNLMNQLKMVRERMRGLAEGGLEGAEDLLGTLATVTSALTEIGVKLEALTMTPETDQIYWVELDPLQHRLTLQVAPLHIGHLMEKYLWHEKSSVVLTSATLTAHGEFDYLKRRLNAEDADELMVGSPFDYEHSTLLYLPSDIPEPTDAMGIKNITEDTITVARAREAYVACFNSYALAARLRGQFSSIGEDDITF